MTERREKRKVGDTSLEDFEQKERVFQKSKLVPRSPTGTREEKDMERILEEIRDMRLDMTKRFNENNEQNKILRNELEKTNRELQQIKEEMKKKEGEWQKEKQELQEKIINLEDRMEQKEKREKRNNIIIKNTGNTEEIIVEDVKDFIKQKLKVDIQVEETFKVNNRITVVKMKDWKEKEKVMKNKYLLNGSDIYIENDMTVMEREIQSKLRKIAKEEKGKGNKVQVKYQKIIINTSTYTWAEIVKNNFLKN